jgi:hypothetical protein
MDNEKFVFHTPNQHCSARTGRLHITLHLNMGYYTIRFHPDSSKICTIVLPWGMYSYLRLPMGVACSPDIFQAKMSKQMGTLEVV